MIRVGDLRLGDVIVQTDHNILILMIQDCIIHENAYVQITYLKTYKNDEQRASVNIRLYHVTKPAWPGGNLISALENCK